MRHTRMLLKLSWEWYKGRDARRSELLAWRNGRVSRDLGLVPDLDRVSDIENRLREVPASSGQ